MNNFDLETKLKGVPVPERTEDYWENFPVQVRHNLRRAPVEFRPHSVWLPRLTWAGGVAFVCLVISLAAWCDRHPHKNPFYTLFQHERVFRQELAQLPNHLRVLMQDEHGMHYLIADQE
jgi:hypothetical protein